MENTRATTHFWTEEQTEFMLNVLKELNILKFMVLSRNVDVVVGSGEEVKRKWLYHHEL